jgi:hypothetical protein
MIEIESILTLRCAHCRRTFPYVAPLEAGEFTGVVPSTKDALASVKAILQNAKLLRELAQQAGWAYVLPIGPDAGKDLCNKCFQLPPEG